MVELADRLAGDGILVHRDAEDLAELGRDERDHHGERECSGQHGEAEWRETSRDQRDATHHAAHDDHQGDQKRQAGDPGTRREQTQAAEQSRNDIQYQRVSEIDPERQPGQTSHGGMDVSEAKRLKTLEDENTKLKRLLADAMLDNVALKDLLGKKW